jgi:acetylornithine deacetylase/succinyl-diaminopimelate desuccinylase-like protein
MALGQIYHRALCVQRYRINVQTMGGHSWVDFGQPSAINELAMLVTRLTALPLAEQPRTSLNVGVILGGTSVNTIAAQAQLELDLRSVDGKALDLLVKRVEALVESTRKPGVEVARELIGQRPAGSIPQNHPLVLLANNCLLEQGIRSNLAIGSTDANVPLSRGIPAVCLGLSTGSGAHTLNEYIYTQPLVKGLRQLASLVRGVYDEL